MKKMEGVLGIVVQGGGPTTVINTTLVNLVFEARLHGMRLYGARYGFTGVVDDDFVDLMRENSEDLKNVARMPSATLGSTREKITAEKCLEMFRIMRAHGVGVFFYIGGNDSAETARAIHEEAQLVGYPLVCIHVPKTIDGDLCGSDHSPGYPSAAWYVAQTVRNLGADSRAFRRAHPIVMMGRGSGWLTAAADFGFAHLVYVPERPFMLDRFLGDVKAVYEKHGHCVIAVSEGVEDESGTLILKKLKPNLVHDAHGNPRLSSSGELASWLCANIEHELGISTQSDELGYTLGYKQRCDTDFVGDIDRIEAGEVGRRAVQYAACKLSGSITIQRDPIGCRYGASYRIVPFEKVAKLVKPLPDEFINEAGNGVTDAFRSYLRPLLQEVPAPIARLKMHRVAKIDQNAA